MIQFINGRCPYCETVFDAGKNTKSNIYKHIRLYATKGPLTRKKHPELGSDAYKEIAQRFRTIAKSAEEKLEMTAARRKRSREPEGVKQKGSGSVNVPMDLEVKKEEEEWLLKLSFEVRERIAKAFRNLMYSPGGCSLTDNARSHIDNPNVIPKPTNTLPLNPSFPQIVFHYLPFETCISHDNRPIFVSEHSDLAILSQSHYDQVLQTRQCSKRVLENVWTQWLRLGDNERNLQYQEANDMKSRWLLFQKVLKGKHGYDLQREHFQEECYEQGYAEIASLLKDGTIWGDVRWESFEYFAELYKPLPKVPGTVVPPRIEDGDEQNGNEQDGEKLDYQGVRGRWPMLSLKEKCVIPGTSSPEL
jgi:hypothetical protein